MKPFYDLILRLLSALLIERVEMQQQLIDAQRQLIATQKELNTVRRQLDKLTPKNVKDNEVLWHIYSGKFSEEAAHSNDLETVLPFNDWLTNVLGKKYIKPYVNPKVYMECLSQMTRGLPKRIAELQTYRDLGYAVPDQLAVDTGRANLTLIRTGR